MDGFLVKLPNCCKESHLLASALYAICFLLKQQTSSSSNGKLRIRYCHSSIAEIELINGIHGHISKTLRPNKVSQAEQS